MALRDLIGGGEPAIHAGEPAPDFELPDATGNRVRLGTFRGQRAVVLYFYPKDDTPGCTKEACAFRDSFEVFKDAGAEVIGVSSDSESSHRKFADKFSLPFPLLADTDHAVAEAWGVWGEKSLYGRKFMGIVRSAFVVDEKGKLAGVFYKVSPKDTVPKAEAVLKAL